jgi:hypothetical protein
LLGFLEKPRILGKWMVTVDGAVLQLQAIDGPLPDALMGQVQYAGGQQHFMQVPAQGAHGMVLSPGQAVPPQQHMGQGIPGVCTLKLFSHRRATTLVLC